MDTDKPVDRAINAINAFYENANKIKTEQTLMNQKYVLLENGELYAYTVDKSKIRSPRGYEYINNHTLTEFPKCIATEVKYINASGYGLQIQTNNDDLYFMAQNGLGSSGSLGVKGNREIL